jgi:hypothetical protein
MESLGVYGKNLREYEGVGSLDLDSGQTCNCRLRAIQLADGKIMANCFLTEDIDLVRGCFRRDNTITSIQGITKDNIEFTLGGQLHYTQFRERNSTDEHNLNMVILASEMTCKRTTINPFQSVRFGITNFEFMGNKFKEYENGGAGLDILTINIADRRIEIHEIPNYKHTIETVKAQRGVDVTSEAIMEACSEVDLDSSIQLIDTLCKLLSLARGTKINWIYYDCYDELGRKTLSFHKNNIAWQFSGLPMIDPRNPNETASFIQQVYGTYLEQKDTHSLDIAIEAYLDAKREGAYLETRALRAAVVMEFLKSKYATRNDIEFVLPKGRFKKVSRAVKRAIKEHSIEMSLSDDLLLAIESKVGELNRWSFRAILETMFYDLGIAITEGELERFIKIRNSLVHRASFLTKDYLQEYTFLISVLDRIFLRILNYSGVFLDITDKFNRVETNPQQSQTKGLAYH